MRIIQFFGITIAIALISTASWAGRGVTEVSEGTVRNVYVDKALTGAKGYLVADWEHGQVRVEVMNFPAADMGYEVFLFQIDIPAYMSKMFVGGMKANGVVADPPPMGDVAGLISQWKIIGSLEMSGDGSGKLIYDGGDNLYDTGLNMVMIFGKVSAGQHAGPEDFSKLMVECNGPLTGTMGSDGMEAALTVLPKN